MKNIFLTFPAILAAIIFAVSCQFQDHGNVADKADVEFTVGLPCSISSYAGGILPEGGLSNLGGAFNVDTAEYDLRYIIEVWTTGTSSERVYRQVETVSRDFTTTKVKFKASLTAMEYDFVFWADFVPEGTAEDNVYITDTEAGKGLLEIKISQDGRAAGCEYADAYYASRRIDLTVSGESIGTVELVRPFGKIRLIATDILNGELPDRPGTSIVEYDASATFPDTFNALTGKASGSLEAGRYEFTVYQETAHLTGYEPIEGAYVIGSDYIFASDAETAYAFDIEVYSSLDPNLRIGGRTVSKIPVMRNRLTTVVGNMYSSAGEIEVIINDTFDNSGNETI